ISDSIPQLKYYEIIDTNHIKHNKIVKRSADKSDNTYEESTKHWVTFRTINRDFNLLLSHNKDIRNANFKAFTVDSKGNKKPIFVDFNEFFSGTVAGENGSDVKAHIGSDGVMTAAIQTVNETYEVEPIWRHLDNYRDNHSMIVYKRSDVNHSSGNESLKPLCHLIKAKDNRGDDYVDTEELIRQKRKALFEDITIGDESSGQPFKPTHTHCAVRLVADHYFYRFMAQLSPKKAINYLIHIIDRVNNIFTNTEWTDDPKRRPGFGGMGFIIKEIQLHTEPSDQKTHYNSGYGNRSVRQILDQFSADTENRQFCLSHLFTHRPFEANDTVLGLASTASPRPDISGGICSVADTSTGRPVYPSTGLTRTRNSFGHTIITREAVLVSAHEFGHSWGAEHDPHTDECLPSVTNGGPYIMHTYSVTGYEANNRFFSPCSKRSIRAVLLSKSHRCFVKPEKSYCGNSIVEADEECDEGLLASGDTYTRGQCCDSRCRLMPGADCSDKNAECCRGCRLSPAGVLCRDRDEMNCRQQAYCDGETIICFETDSQCLEARPVADGSDCLDRGQCQAGKCVAYCTAIGRQPCLCEQPMDACYRCCRLTNNTCRPLEPRDPLSDGTPCRYGFCDKQICQKQIQDFVGRFWKVIDKITINSFVRFMKDNIVGAVVVVTLIVWIPIGCAINFYDQKQMEELRRRRRPRRFGPGIARSTAGPWGRRSRTTVYRRF
ncbi:unnamed protein product, partial [Medioppia subpectinata]